MLITCPSCTRSYEVEAASLGEAGRSVRCTRCKTVWFAAAPAPAAAAPDVTEDDPFWGTASDASEPMAADPFGAAVEQAEGAGGRPIPSGVDAPPAEDAESPPLVPAIEEPAAETLPGEAAPGEDIESVALRRARLAREQRQRRGDWSTGMVLLILVLVSVLAGLIAWRAQVVRHLPQTAAFYAAIGLPVNLRGVEFQDIRITGETQDNVPVLVVQGSIVNIGTRMVEVPRLRFALRNETGLEVYAWTTLPPKPVLAAGEAVQFRSRLASPPVDTRDVLVRFFNRRDVEARR